MNTDMKELMQYTGNQDQVFYAQRMCFDEGKAKGLEFFEVDTGGGLQFQVMAGRGMDIGRLKVNGMNVSFLSKAGFSEASYYDSREMEGIHTFSPGFLTTCGLRNSGLPCIDEEEAFGFHGRIGQTPASQISVEKDLSSEEPYIRISGSVREGRLFGASFELHRSITVYYGQKKIDLTDTITNLSATSEEWMMLYHFNLGYPFLTENARFITSHEYEKAVDQNALRGEHLRKVFKKPLPAAPENCFYYRQKRDDAQRSYAGCVNPDSGLGVMIQTVPEELPLLCNWHSWAAGDYVMGIEPCNCYGDGRSAHRKRSQLQRLEPYESRQHHISIIFSEFKG